jgi:hypothetical protein
VAISALMPGRRVKTMNKGFAPDILLDVTPNALRGVETAGRTKGGRSELLTVRDGTPVKGKKTGHRAKLRSFARARTSPRSTSPSGAHHPASASWSR